MTQTLHPVPAPSPGAASTEGSGRTPCHPWPIGHTAFWMVSAAFVALRWWATHQAPIANIDADVYLRGAQALLRGEDPYGVSVHGLMFTYSPFGAAVFTPLVALPPTFAYAILLSTSVACLVVTMCVVARRLHVSPTTTVTMVMATALGEPFFRGTLLGQINMLLMAMVVADLLVLPRGRQGLLIGLAAGIKVIPGIFVFYLLLRRDWRGVLWSAAGFGLSVVVGGVVSPGATRWYWTGGVTQLGKFGRAGVFATDNQSLSAFVDRLLQATSLPTAVLIPCLLASTALSVLVARVAVGHGDEVVALLALAVGGLLASPVSWTHHWIWCGPLGLMLLARRRRVALALIGAVFLVGPMWLIPVGHLRQLPATWWQTLLGGSYVVVGLAALLVLLRLASEARPGGGDDIASSVSDAGAGPIDVVTQLGPGPVTG